MIPLGSAMVPRVFPGFLLLLAMLHCSCSKKSTEQLADSSDNDATPRSSVEVRYSESREACAARDPKRQVLFGDLHVHTGFSFDAYSYGNWLRPADAFSFAKGGEVHLPPIENGVGARTAKLPRPLDFLAVTDHGEFLGEIHQCTTPGTFGYDSSVCTRYRDPEGNGAFQFGMNLSGLEPVRDPEICGEDLGHCHESAKERWSQMREAAEDAYDKSAACTFTSFVAYEYTNTFNVSNLHRNVFFRNAVVPELPVTYYEAPYPDLLWKELEAQCLEGLDGCDVIVIPHNSNLSNGQLFTPNFRGAETREAKKERLTLRAKMEPLVEIFQAKGDSECRDGFTLEDAPSDPLCAFEKMREDPFEDCGDEVGTGGMRLWGCLHRLDFVRYVLKEGLREAREYGVNPYEFGFVGATDTHNGTPGHVDARGFPGHVGTADDTPEKRLGPGTVTHEGIVSNPGGITAVWAVENSRDAIFDAFRRREVYATSGPRIATRFFGGWSFADNLCEDHGSLVDTGYSQGVPMGSALPAPKGDKPQFLVWAQMDEGTSEDPGVPLQRIQIIKGWIDADGETHEKVYEVAGDANNGASVDESTCTPVGEGASSLCARWTDPSFDPEQSAFYYSRVVQNPTCRWSTRQCAEFPEAERPEGCDGLVQETVQERAYTSPIRYVPQASGNAER